MLRRKNVEIPLDICKECILLLIFWKCCFSQECWTCCQAHSDLEQVDHCLPRSLWLSERAQSCSAVHMEYICSERSHDLENAWRRQGMLLLPKLFYLAQSFPDICPAWCVKHLKQSRAYMNLFYRAAICYVSPVMPMCPEIQYSGEKSAFSRLTY